MPTLDFGDGPTVGITHCCKILHNNWAKLSVFLSSAASRKKIQRKEEEMSRVDGEDEGWTSVQITQCNANEKAGAKGGI